MKVKNERGREKGEGERRSVSEVRCFLQDLGSPGADVLTVDDSSAEADRCLMRLYGLKVKVQLIDQGVIRRQAWTAI